MSDANGSSRRRTVLTHWVPLAITLAVATAGVAAWALSRKDDDDDEHDGLDYGAPPPTSRSAPDAGPSAAAAGEPSWGTRVAERLRRTPSPQQVLGTAGKTVAAGVAAVGTALSSIREEDKAAFKDHETWSEEAEKQERGSVAGGKPRRSVAVVVSADTGAGEGDDFEHATILSHLPKNVDFETTKLFVLIYAPGLKEAPGTGNEALPPSLGSSFSNIDHEQAQPAEESKSPAANAAVGDAAFNAVYSQARALVEEEAMVLPFTSPNGHVYILRHLQPETVYLQESLSGDNGSAVTQIQTWLRHELVLVVGTESGHGGLADSESEAENKGGDKKWWEREDRVGRGRGVVVVDGVRVNDDWKRRVQRLE